MKNINFMCIDPSKNCTGILIKHENELILYSIKQKIIGKEKYTYISKKGKREGQKITGSRSILEPDSTTINRIYEDVKEKIRLYNIKLVIVECNPFAGFNRSRSPSSLAEIIGIIKLACFGIAYIPISNMLWKGILKGMLFLNTKKNIKYIQLAKKYFERDFETCDEVDAFCIAVAMNTLYNKYAFTDAQVKMKNKLTEIVKKIENSEKELF